MVLFVGLNIGPRKMHPLLLLAFKRYLRSNPDAFLYLHTPPAGFYAMDLITRAAGLAGSGRVIIRATEGNQIGWGVPESTMRDLYRTADVFLHLSSAEGFNAPLVEAACMGLPSVVTDFPVHREVLDPFPESQRHFVPAKMVYPTPYNYVWMADADAAGDLLVRAVAAGRQKPKYPGPYRWSQIGKKFEGILESAGKFA